MGEKKLWLLMILLSLVFSSVKSVDDSLTLCGCDVIQIEKSDFIRLI